jgi:hypothetical protein
VLARSAALVAPSPTVKAYYVRQKASSATRTGATAKTMDRLKRRPGSLRSRAETVNKLPDALHCCCGRSAPHFPFLCYAI